LPGTISKAIGVNAPEGSLVFKLGCRRIKDIEQEPACPANSATQRMTHLKIPVFQKKNIIPSGVSRRSGYDKSDTHPIRPSDQA
jgi:hypothetical protein